MASIPSFIFGAGTKYKTQEELERAREQVKEMLGDIGQSGYTGWGGVMADLGKGIGARIEKGRIGEGQEWLTGQQAPFSQTLAEIAGGFGGGGGGGAVTGDAGADALAGGAGGDAAGYLRYANQGATRNQPLSPKLEQALGYLGDLGITAEVFSGGQDAEGPNRVGSHRHDEGNAGDVRFYKDGRQLSWKNKEDIPLFQEIVRRGKAAGITGFGAGPGYMGEGSMHIGYGTPAVWGAGGQGANAAGWLRDAYSGSGANSQAGGVGADPVNDAFTRPPPSSGGSGMGAYRDAIAKIESAGSGDYAAVGRPDPKLGRPLGRYQIMERNIGPWSKKHLGREVSAQEFLQSPAIQDAIFDGEFGGYVQKYGREGAAQAWLGGPGAVGKDDRADALGTSVGEYGRRFMGNLGDGGGADALAGSGRGPSLVQARPVPISEAGLRTPQGQEFLKRMTGPYSLGQQPPPMVPGMTGPMPAPAPVQTPPSPRQPTPPVLPAQPPIPTARPAPPPPALAPITFDLHDRRRMTPAMTNIGLDVPGESMAGTETAPRIAPAPVPVPAPRIAPAPVPVPTPHPAPKVDPFTDMILGDKAAQFRPGNFSQPLPPGVAAGGLQAARQALAGPLVGGGGSNTQAGGAGSQFPAAPPAPGTPAAAGFGVPRAGGGGGAFPPAPAAPGPGQPQRVGGGPQDAIGKLMFILASPYSSDEQKRMATAMLQREYALEDERRKAAAEQASPEYKLGLRKLEAEVDKLENPSPGHRLLTPEEVAAIPNADPAKVYQKDLTSGSISVLTGATPEDGGLINLGDGVLYDTKLRKVVYDQSKEGGPKAPDFDDTSGVRKEIQALPSYKNLSQAAPIWSSVVEAAGHPTTQADLAIVLGIAKIMDPTSVVRTEEGQAVKDTGGASTELAKWFSYLTSKSDAVLDDGIREKLLAEGYGRVKAYEDEYTRDTEFYGQFADRKKIDRADIIRVFPPSRQWKPGTAKPVSPSVKKKTDEFLGGGG